VIGIHLPPLRDRRPDIPLLAYHFLAKYNQKLKKNIREISLEAMQVLQAYSWVGNVRELENVMERSTVLVKGEVIQVKDLPAYLYSKAFQVSEMEDHQISKFCYKEAKDRALSAFHHSYLHHLLKESKGNISLASQHAKIDRSNLKKIIKKYDVNTAEFKKD
jgi:DNA-binding NtrC family response regulator